MGSADACYLGWGASVGDVLAGGVRVVCYSNIVLTRTLAKPLSTYLIYATHGFTLTVISKHLLQNTSSVCFCIHPALLFVFHYIENFSLH